MKFNGCNVTISKKAVIGRNVKIGDNTIIYENVEIKDNSIIANNCVIGEPLNDYYFNENYENPRTVINENSLIRSHTIIYAGCDFGEHFNTGHYVTIREFTTSGRNCSIGTKSDLQGFCNFGDFCRLHSFVNVGQYSTLQNFIFIYPFVVLTNDSKPPSNSLNGPTIGNFSQIGSSSVILPGIKIGKHCLIGANSVVNKDLQNYSFANGNPAKIISDIRKLPIFTNNKKHYPWPYNFERGMPWEGLEFENWLLESKYD